MMSRHKKLFAFTAYVSAWIACGAVQAQPLGTAFTYQGQLRNGGSPADGPHDFEFSLWSDSLAGSQVGPTLLFDGVGGNPPSITVTDGLFSVELDFGVGAFNGEARWLQISVNGTPLTPRQRVAPAPLALALPGLYTRENTTSPNVIGGFSANEVGVGVIGATIGGGGTAANLNRVSDDYGTVGGGRDNQTGDGAGTTADRAYATVGGGLTNIASALRSTVGGGEGNQSLGSGSTVGGGVINVAGASTSTVAGGFNNQANGIDSAIGGGGANRATVTYAVVGGGFSNTAGGVRSTIGGGGDNTANGSRSTVGGGQDNQASSDNSTVGGGRNNQAGGIDSTVGGGQNNQASSDNSTVGGGFLNTANGVRSTVGGGVENTAGASTSTVAGGFNNQASGIDSTIGGGQNNQASVASTTVGGGVQNTASGIRSTIGGGQNNQASSDNSTVGGGVENTASGGNSTVGGGSDNVASMSSSTVAGGFNNQASGFVSTVGGGIDNIADGFVSTVGGGSQNTASGGFSTVGGGFQNTANGGTVPGGDNNAAEGDYSFAAGQRAKAIHAGAFVWGDSTDSDIQSSTNDQFTVRSVGGARFFSNANLTAGVQLAAGGSSWSSVSDRNMKENFALVDAREVLERIAAMPILTWNYKAQDASIRHIGPMAQDFSAAFNLGEDDLRINTIDIDGVALVAIQGLYEVVKEQNARIAALRIENDAQLVEKDKEIAGLVERLERLERTVLNNTEKNEGGAQ